MFGDLNLPIGLVFESELDALLVAQEAWGIAFTVALGGSTKPIDYQTDLFLRGVPNLFFCPDFDEAGKKAWDSWKAKYPTIRRLLTSSSKSAGDAFLEGLDLRNWIVNALKVKIQQPTSMQ